MSKIYKVKAALIKREVCFPTKLILSQLNQTMGRPEKVMCDIRRQILIGHGIG